MISFVMINFNRAGMQFELTESLINLKENVWFSNLFEAWKTKCWSIILQFYLHKIESIDFRCVKFYPIESRKFPSPVEHRLYLERKSCMSIRTTDNYISFTTLHKCIKMYKTIKTQFKNKNNEIHKNMNILFIFFLLKVGKLKYVLLKYWNLKSINMLRKKYILTKVLKSLFD